MIKFQTLQYELDLSNLPISFNEISNRFETQTVKSYSLPFNMELTHGIIEKLGLVTVDNIVDYEDKIYGSLILDDEFYDAYIAINEVVGNKAELTLYYGKETLKVFDKKLKELPFNTTVASGGLPTFAKAQLTKSWPEATHNFPKVFRPELKEEANYERFEGFINNYIDNAGTWEFPINTNDLIEGEQVDVNRNIMAPFTYLLEVLRVGFKTEGLDIRGDFVNDALVQKLLLVPKNYFEQYAATQFLNYSFSNFTFQETINGQTINVYRQIHTPISIGAYSINIRVNMSNVLAKYFSLTITQNGIELYSAFSQNNEVSIDTEVQININDVNVLDDIIVEMKLSNQTEAIAAYNEFKYEYTEGQLNIFPSIYNIANYMPDITFRKLVNFLKTWLNLDFTYTDKAVYINYLEQEFSKLTFRDHSHLQQVDPKRTINKNNLFKLTYPDGQEVLVNKNGQTFTATDYIDNEIEKIEMEVLPLKIRDNQGNLTAVYPKDEEDVMLVLFNGPVDNNNLCVDKINNISLSLQDVYNLHYKNWLRFRANSETYTDSFFMHISEVYNIDQGSFKYNKNHLIKSIDRKRVNEKYWKVDVESETL